MSVTEILLYTDKHQISKYSPVDKSEKNERAGEPRRERVNET